MHCITFLAPKIYFKVPSPLLEHLDFIVLLKVGYQMKSRIKKCPNHKNLFLFFSCKPKFQETSHLVPKNMEETSMEASHILITANADEGWRRGEPKDDEGNPQNWLTWYVNSPLPWISCKHPCAHVHFGRHLKWRKRGWLTSWRRLASSPPSEKRRSDTRSDGGAGQDESLDDVDELNHKGDAAGKVDKGQSFHPDAEKKLPCLGRGVCTNGNYIDHKLEWSQL